MTQDDGRLFALGAMALISVSSLVKSSADEGSMAKRKYEPRFVREVLDYWNNNRVTWEEVASHFSLESEASARELVNRYAKRHGLKVRRATPMTSEERREKALALYEAGRSVKQIGAELGYPSSSVKAVVARAKRMLALDKVYGRENNPLRAKPKGSSLRTVPPSKMPAMLDALSALKEERARLWREFEAKGGRGVELADQIDDVDRYIEDLENDIAKARKAGGRGSKLKTVRPEFDPWSLQSFGEDDASEMIFAIGPNGRELFVHDERDLPPGSKIRKKYLEWTPMSSFDYAAADAMRSLGVYWDEDDPHLLATGYKRPGGYDQPLHEDVSQVIDVLQNWREYVKKKQEQAIAKSRRKK